MMDRDVEDVEEYNWSVPLKGKAAAKTILMGQNFRIVESTETELAGEGEGMRHSKEHPLRGATRIRVRVQGTHLALSAVLGGVNRMKWFLILFPPGLGIVLGVSFWLSGMGVEPLWISLASVCPWIILGPFIGGLIKKRCVASLDTLLHNITSTGP